MDPLFTTAANDQSILYLGQIFGLVGGVLPVQDAPLILGAMFKVLNTMALTLGTIMVIYVTVIGVLATAHEGEFMGKKWSGMWVPIRMVFGIVALFPTATGYCTLQVVMMWIIVQGVGAADMVWTSVLSYVSVAGSPYASVSGIPSTNVRPNVEAIFKGLSCQASALIRDKSMSYIPPGQTDSKAYYYCSTITNPDSDPFCKLVTPDNSASTGVLNIKYVAGSSQVTNNGDTLDYNMGPGGSCGKITYANPQAASNCGNDSSSVACAMAKAQQDAIQAVVLVLGNIAAKVAAADHEYLAFNYMPISPTPTWLSDFCKTDLSITNPKACCVKQYDPNFVFNPTDPSAKPDIVDCDAKSSFPLFHDETWRSPSANAITNPYMKYAITPLNYGDFITASVNQYIQTMAGTLASTISSQPVASFKEQWLKDAQSTGWILAGGYYYRMAKLSDNTLKSATPVFTVSPTLPTPSDDKFKWFRNNYSTAEKIIQTFSSSSSTSSSSTPPEFAGVSSSIGGASAAMARGLVNALTADDPQHDTQALSRIVAYGQFLMKMAEMTFGVTVVLVMVLVAVATIDPIVLGNGITQNPWGEALKTVIGFVGPFFVALVGAMFSLGAMLGIYIPLIPYIIFTMGAVGWFIATIEAMVACPMIALGILSPAGQHEILGRAEPAVMLIFNLFLRPSLMVFGMMAAMLLTNVAIKLLNAGFLNITLNQIMGGGDIGAFEQIIIIGAYVSLLMTIMNKTFSLIHVIPERVLTWIGGQAVQYGEAEAAGETKRGIEGAASGSAGAGKAAGAAAEAGAEKTAMAQQKQSGLDKGTLKADNK